MQCWAIVYVSADIQTFLLSHGALATLGVLSPSFPSLGEHANADMQECAGELAAITNAHLTRTVTCGCASLGDENHSCICPQRTAVPPAHGCYHFAVFPKIIIGYWSDTLPPHLTHVRIALFIACWDHPLKSMSAPEQNQGHFISWLLFFTPGPCRTHSG